MAVYKKERPEYLRAALDSMLNQTVKADQIVLLCDGSLTHELDAVVGNAADAGEIEPVRVMESKGYGHSLNFGIDACRNEYVFRMDSDDLSRPHRCEKTLLYMKEKDLDACGAWIEEFMSAPGDLNSVRKLPENNSELIKYAKRRNPINNMTGVFKKSAALSIGGYRHMQYFEDYDFWVRLLAAGFKLGNCPEILVDARVGYGMYNRRGGLSYCKCIRDFFKDAYKTGFIDRTTYCQNVLLRCAVSVMPGGLRGVFYRRALRDKDNR